MSEDTPADVRGRDVKALRAIMRALRTPETGCPWDLEQSFETIVPYTIEEAYEVADAIERKDMDALREELGDLLLQVVYHAQMAEEAGAFGFDDVAAAICDKMIRRHPHVFGDEEARLRGIAKGFWEEMKSREKAAKAARGSGEETGESGSALSGVPSALPALVRAVKLQTKAARVGFDWPEPAPVFGKIDEELAELREAAATPGPGNDEVEEELGDLLFALANLARHLEIDPEAALRRANAKFTTRFEAIEAGLAAQGKRPADSTLEEMDALWNEAKAKA